MDNLYLYRVEADYLRYLHRIDRRVSVKNNRAFVGIVVMINGIQYLIPLTSKTTAERINEGKRKRSSMVTLFIRDSSDTEIASLLYNNMIPVRDNVCLKLNIDMNINTYELNELRFIRKNKSKIINKAQHVYNNRINGGNLFLNHVCCDFKRLEQALMDYTK